MEAATRAGVQRVLLISSLFVTDRHKRNPIRIMLNTLRWRMMDNKVLLAAISNPTLSDPHYATCPVPSCVQGITPFCCVELLHAFMLGRHGLNINPCLDVLLQLKGEQRVREAGVPYTIVRPGRFVSKPQGAPVKLKTGQGDTISGSICPVDVAAICVAALRNPATSGVTFEVHSCMQCISIRSARCCSTGLLCLL